MLKTQIQTFWGFNLFNNHNSINIINVNIICQLVLKLNLQQVGYPLQIKPYIRNLDCKHTIKWTTAQSQRDVRILSILLCYEYSSLKFSIQPFCGGLILSGITSSDELVNTMVYSHCFLFTRNNRESESGETDVEVHMLMPFRYKGSESPFGNKDPS